MRVQLADRGQLGKIARHSSGALKIPAQLARVGVLDYPERGERHLVLPEELFAPETVASLADAPVTVEHPSEGEVTGDSWQRLAAGHVSADVAPRAQWLAGTLMVSRADAARAVEDRDLREVSCGYTCELEPSPGAYLGDSYTHVKRGIRYNHVALGPEGWARAGRDARLMIDSSNGENKMALFKPIQVTPKGVLSFDGRAFDFADADQRAAGTEAVRANLRSVQLADAAAPEAVRAALDEALGTLRGVADQLMALAEAVATPTEPEMPDSVEAAEAALPAAVLDGIAAKHAPKWIEVRDQAKKIAPELNLDGMSLAEIRRKAVIAAGHEMPENASDDYVAGVFGAMPAAGTFSTRDRDSILSGGAGGGEDTIAAAYKDRREVAKNAWKRKSA